MNRKLQYSRIGSVIEEYISYYEKTYYEKNKRQEHKVAF